MDREQIKESSRIAAERIARGPLGTRPVEDYLPRLVELKKQVAAASEQQGDNPKQRRST